jgi:hypothetical protein
VKYVGYLACAACQVQQIALSARRQKQIAAHKESRREFDSLPNIPIAAKFFGGGPGREVNEPLPKTIRSGLEGSISDIGFEPL